MKRFLFLAALMTAWTPMMFAAPQIVSGAGNQAITGSGVADGASFIAQAVDESTLTVGDGVNINESNLAIGVQTSDPVKGNILFQGSTGTSIVNGSVGLANGNKLDNISGGLGSSIIIFNGITNADTYNITGNGTMQFNANSSGALQFNTDGTLVIGAGATFSGALTNLSTNSGTLTLNAASTLIGAAGTIVSPLKQINVLAGNAAITGATRATNFSLAANTLAITGALNLPVNTVINTTVISDTVFGNVNIGAATDTIAAPVVLVNVDASQALLTGAPLFVVSAGAGTSNVPITVTSNSIRYTFVGNNFLGNITIQPTLVPLSQLTTSPSAAAVGTVLNNLLPVAAANPGSDLAFVELQLNALPTAAALQDALLQIAPASGLVGVGRESFNTTRQFQKVWLEQLQYDRKKCLFQNDCYDPCDPCNPCRSICKDLRLWTDGFGYYGNQDDRCGLNGYQARTWGFMVGVEKPWECGLRVGLAGGYAYTDLDERDFGNNTDIHNYEGTLYFSYDPYRWFVDGGFSYGWNRYDGTRHIVFPGIDRTARAEYDGSEYSGFLITGYHYYCNYLSVTPFVSLLYSHLHINDYKEKGADSLNLRIDSQNYNFLESGLGVKADYLIETNCGAFVPEVHTIWIHDFYDKGLNVNAAFTGLGAAGGSFHNTGPNTDLNTWNIGTSITCYANSHFSIIAAYDYERSRTYYDHQGLLELSYDF